jgi:hypothetical protein
MDYYLTWIELVIGDQLKASGWTNSSPGWNSIPVAEEPGLPAVEILAGAVVVLRRRVRRRRWIELTY